MQTPVTMLGIAPGTRHLQEDVPAGSACGRPAPKTRRVADKMALRGRLPVSPRGARGVGMEDHGQLRALGSVLSTHSPGSGDELSKDGWFPAEGRRVTGG